MRSPVLGAQRLVQGAGDPAAPILGLDGIFFMKAVLLVWSHAAR
jgi:hypothetical protein